MMSAGPAAVSGAIFALLLLVQFATRIVRGDKWFESLLSVFGQPGSGRRKNEKEDKEIVQQVQQKREEAWLAVMRISMHLGALLFTISFSFCLLSEEKCNTRAWIYGLCLYTTAYVLSIIVQQVLTNKCLPARRVLDFTYASFMTLTAVCAFLIPAKCSWIMVLHCLIFSVANASMMQAAAGNLLVTAARTWGPLLVSGVEGDLTSLILIELYQYVLIVYATHGFELLSQASAENCVMGAPDLQCENEALMSVLNATCDAVLHLDEHLVIKKPAPKLNMMLGLRGSDSLEGYSITNLLQATWAAKKFQMCVDKPFVIPSADGAPGVAQTFSLPLKMAQEGESMNVLFYHAPIRGARGHLLGMSQVMDWIQDSAHEPITETELRSGSDPDASIPSPTTVGCSRGMDQMLNGSMSRQSSSHYPFSSQQMSPSGAARHPGSYDSGLGRTSSIGSTTRPWGSEVPAGGHPRGDTLRYVSGGSLGVQRITSRRPHSRPEISARRQHSRTGAVHSFMPSGVTGTNSTNTGGTVFSVLPRPAGGFPAAGGNRVWQPQVSGGHRGRQQAMPSPVNASPGKLISLDEMLV